MRLFQSDLEEIQELTKKEYEVQYSNNADSEYVKIYDEDVIEDIIEQLLKYIEDKNEEYRKLKEDYEDLEIQLEEYYTPKNISRLYGINERDLH